MNECFTKLRSFITWSTHVHIQLQVSVVQTEEIIMEIFLQLNYCEFRGFQTHFLCTGKAKLSLTYRRHSLFPGTIPMKRSIMQGWALSCTSSSPGIPTNENSHGGGQVLYLQVSELQELNVRGQHPGVFSSHPMYEVHLRSQQKLKSYINLYVAPNRAYLYDHDPAV